VPRAEKGSTRGGGLSSRARAARASSQSQSMHAAPRAIAVVAMLNMLKADLEKEMQSANVEEKDAQEEYESMMAESAEKRASDSKSLADKESAKADLESKALKLKEEETATMTEVLGAAETLKNLHIECDWLVSNFEVRKEARAGEVDALKKAKAVLSGADYSLIQTGRSNLRGA